MKIAYLAQANPYLSMTPPREQHVKIAIQPGSTHLGSVKQLDLEVSELLGVTDVIRPVLVALDAGEPLRPLHHVGQHHHHPHVVLPDHFPEGWGRVLARTLGSEELL